MLRDLLRLFHRGEASEATLLDVGKAIAFGTEEQARDTAQRWAIRQRDLEQAAAEREQHEAAVRWMTDRVMKSPSRCWMPQDE